MIEQYLVFYVLYICPVRLETSGHSEGLHSGLLAEDLVPLTRPGESPRTASRKCTGWIQCRPALHQTEPRRSLSRARWWLVDFVSGYRNASALNPIAITERGSFSECFSFFPPHRETACISVPWDGVHIKSSEPRYWGFQDRNYEAGNVFFFFLSIFIS